jgi:hypothetical protein
MAPPPPDAPAPGCLSWFSPGRRAGAAPAPAGAPRPAAEDLAAQKRAAEDLAAQKRAAESTADLLGPLAALPPSSAHVDPPPTVAPTHVPTVHSLPPPLPSSLLLPLPVSLLYTHSLPPFQVALGLGPLAYPKGSGPPQDQRGASEAGSPPLVLSGHAASLTPY